MITESKAVPYSHNVSFLFRVVISEHLQQLDLNLSLLVKFLLILQNFEGYMLFLRVGMVYTAKDYSEGSSTQLLHYFISVINLVSSIIQVIAIFSVKPIIKLLYRVTLLLLLLLLLYTAILTIIGHGLLSHHGLCNIPVVVEYEGFAVGSEVHVVDDGELFHLVSLEGRHVPSVPLQHFGAGHWEVH
jgi:hypothetical protein